MIASASPARTRSGIVQCPIDPSQSSRIDGDSFYCKGNQKGLGSGPSFNVEYDKYLPLAMGHTILIETHAGVPIVDVGILERDFPSASDGLKKGKTIVGDTALIFVDFADALSFIKPDATEQ